MDSSLKYPVDTVSDSMDNLSLLKVTTNESIWPQRNCMAQTIEQLNQPVFDFNSNTTTASSLTGFGDSKPIQDMPGVYQNCDSSSPEKTSRCGSSYTGNCEKPISAESTSNCVGVVGDSTQTRNSSFHQMTLRPKSTSVSPRHCIITLYDTEDESSDADYTVDQAEWDYTSSDEEEVPCLEILTSSDEDDSDSEGETLDKNETVPSDDEEDSESSSSDEESEVSDEESELSNKKSSSSEEATEFSGSDDDENVLQAEESPDSSRGISLQAQDSGDCDEEYRAFLLRLAKDTQLTDSNLDQSGSSGTWETYDSSFTSNPTQSEMEEMYGEESTNDRSIDLIGSTEYSSEDFNQSA